jgi:hypothetical protein
VLRGGLRSRLRPEYLCVSAIAECSAVPLATPGLFLEYEEVLLREETLAATGFGRQEMEDFLDTLAALVEPVRVDFDWRPFLPDSDDDQVANSAFNGDADCVVSNNLRHLRPIETRFGIPVMSPSGFVAALLKPTD